MLYNGFEKEGPLQRKVVGAVECFALKTVYKISVGGILTAIISGAFDPID